MSSFALCLYVIFLLIDCTGFDVMSSRRIGEACHFDSRVPKGPFTLVRVHSHLRFIGRELLHELFTK